MESEEAPQKEIGYGRRRTASVRVRMLVRTAWALPFVIVFSSSMLVDGKLIEANEPAPGPPYEYTYTCTKEMEACPKVKNRF